MAFESKMAKNGVEMYFEVDKNGKKKRIKPTGAIIIDLALKTRDEYRAKINAERDEILSTPLVSIDAQDAAINAEIELANSNAELDENYVDDSDGNSTATNANISNRFYKVDDNGNLIQISYEQNEAETDLALAKFCGLSAEEYAAIQAEIQLDNTYAEPDQNNIAVSDNNEIKLANKPAKKRYAINPVINVDDEIKFNHLDILITANGELRIDGWFRAKRIETAYRHFRNIMAQAANDIPLLKGWGYESLPPANKISECDGHFYAENGDYLFTNNDPRDTFAVDINEDNFYFFGNFSAETKPLEGFNYDAATEYQPQTHWVNPHNFTITGELSDRNLNGRIIAQRIAREQEQERKELKADGVQYLLIVKIPQLHPFRTHDFKLATANYKSFDALKKLGGSRINDNVWRIEDIDGNFIANGFGVADFNNFFYHKVESTLTDNMILAKQITDKLGNLLVKFSHAGEGNNGGLALHYDTFTDFNDEFGTLTRLVEVFTDRHNFILDHVNFITGYGDEKKVEQFFFHHDDFNATDDFNDKLAKLKDNVAKATALRDAKQAALDKAQEEFLQADAALEDANRQIIQLGEDKARELRDTLFTTELLNAHKMTITAQNGNSHLTKLKTLCINFDCFDHNFFITVDKEASVITFKLATYDTTEQVTCAVNLLIDAIKRGVSEFKFPTPDELKPQEPTNKQINDSLIRAMETNFKNIQAHLLNNDINAAVAELILYHICDNALLRKEVTSCTLTNSLSGSNSAA